MAAPATPRGRRKKISDEELRAELDKKVPVPEIAAKYDCSESAIYARIAKLGQSTIAAAVAPAESERYVESTLVELEQLVKNLRLGNKEMDACDAWLTDPDHPDRYYLGPRAEEVQIVYLDADSSRRKATLAELLRRVQFEDAFADVLENIDPAVDEIFADGDDAPLDVGKKQSARRASVRGVLSVTSRYADPRELILKCQQETRATIQTGIELSDRILQMKEAQAWIDEFRLMLQELDPAHAQRVAEGVRRRLSHGSAFGGGASLPPASRPN